MESEVIVPVELPAIRYCTPTKLDQGRKGTVVLVRREVGAQLYIQVKDCDDLEDPEWVPMGAFLESVFSEFTNDAEFLTECMVIYQYKQEKKFNRVSEIIKDRMK